MKKLVDRVKAIATWTAGMDQLSDIATVVATTLDAHNPKPFVLWLSGELGAGKTTFAGFLLHALGVDRNVPILSPTYTYLIEYKTPGHHVGHMDLYRLVVGDHESVDAVLGDRPLTGMIVEWPERAKGASMITPTHLMTIQQTHSMDLDTRRFEFSQVFEV